jgi:hypothetical protein
LDTSLEEIFANGAQLGLRAAEEEMEKREERAGGWQKSTTRAGGGEWRLVSKKSEKERVGGWQKSSRRPDGRPLSRTEEAYWLSAAVNEAFESILLTPRLVYFHIVESLGNVSISTNLNVRCFIMANISSPWKPERHHSQKREEEDAYIFLFPCLSAAVKNITC